ncbi:FtsX-like permease family protein [Ureibacillus acetophenoni]|uniref:FtsX-like permease family protein n=1 Tax=Ureibacillus acetophenoni TaxID=614649 RepID=A0A285UCM0_9BACL|nr:ABC transporter permease [Ureibacillus acetophenoni]SOC39148.1 FtsX-like permease family protein [Ureibacillus acetophenoni]
MTLSKLVLRSMRKNLKHYYLYFFALIFSVTLCFSFTTLYTNPSVIETLEKSGTASTGFEVASYILYFIVTFFVLYANHLFMKRRSKEIGLYQLIGMTKGLVVRLIALENIILFILAVGVGMVLGFLSSRIFAMILLRLVELEAVVDLTFSIEALTQSTIVFTILLVVILIQMIWMIRRVSLLSLFNASKKADERIKPFGVFQMIMGIIGIALIYYGYYKSTQLFNIADPDAATNLFMNMLLILASTIFGTFLFFRFSVSFIMNLLRSRKKGHLNVVDVLAISPIMHRMKSNAKSLTLITTLTALAIGIMGLSYISYYSSENNARQSSPYDYMIIDNKGVEFLELLNKEGIRYEKEDYLMSEVDLNIEELISNGLKDSPLFFTDEMKTSVISLSDFQKKVPNVEINDGEALLTSYVNVLSEIMPLQKEKNIVAKTEDLEVTLFVTDIREDFLLYSAVNTGGPVLVVTDDLFDQISASGKERTQIGINLKDNNDLEKAEAIYEDLADARGFELEIVEGHPFTHTPSSYEELRKENIATFGMTIFVTAFLGLAFLLTTGSILYFKQMAEAEDEKESYTTLRKIGFSTSNIMKGIYAKQLFSFGVPLFIGLLHSYFAVKSGWFLFGTEFETPLMIIMSLYILMYGVFAVLTIQYYKRVVNNSL